MLETAFYVPSLRMKVSLFEKLMTLVSDVWISSGAMLTEEQ